MRIALDISAALAGESGIKFYVERMLGGFERVGGAHEFLLYAAFWRDPGRLSRLNLPAARNFRVTFKRAPQRLLLRAEEAFGLALQERLLSGDRPDLFHGMGNILPVLKRTPSVLTIHHVGGELDQTDSWSRFYFETLTHASMRRADAVIAVSDFSRRKAAPFYGVNPDKIVTVLEGGPLPDYRPARPGDAPAPVQGPYILCVSGIVERKNHAALARAYASLLRKNPALPHRLVLAGGKGRYYPVVAALVRDLGIESRTVFLEGQSREALISLYQNAAVFVYPSLLEGFGFPVLEAMACGTPVVASDASSIPQVAGSAAALADARDPEALSAEIGRVLEDAAWAQELKVKGLARVKEFSWEKSAAETLKVYESLTEGGPLR